MSLGCHCSIGSNLRDGDGICGDCQRRTGIAVSPDRGFVPDPRLPGRPCSLARVELELDPEPSPEARAAVERALAELAAEEGGPTAWWRAGVRENVGLAEDDP